MKLVCVVAEWEAVRNAEQAKDALSQQVSAEATAASNSQADTFNQQVAMMPVQVREPEPQPNRLTSAGNEWTALSKLPPPPSPPAPSGPGRSQRSGSGTSCLPRLHGYPPTGIRAPTFHQAQLQRLTASTRYAASLEQWMSRGF